MARQVIEITDGAAEQIKSLLKNRPALGIRIGTKQGGCSGLEYKFEYVDKVDPTDIIVEDKDVKLYIQLAAELHLIGMTMDYHSNKIESGFTFNNPNAKGSCGCGKSFTV